MPHRTKYLAHASSNPARRLPHPCMIPVVFIHAGADHGEEKRRRSPPNIERELFSQAFRKTAFKYADNEFWLLRATRKMITDKVVSMVCEICYPMQGGTIPCLEKCTAQGFVIKTCSPQLKQPTITKVMVA
uniref:Uncharacterized protein n=1 Tax=Pristionchus pacificus TaxID=54126 RepID=A0A2A6CM47_PRIPA|eukprot:PDM79101.1 hypothetical protein PRIPAC_31680 [Pristionchus pacificus]